MTDLPTMSTKSVSEGMFKNCTGLESVSIPDGVISIGSRAFEGCSNLKDVSFPDSVENLWRNAFKDCVKLTSIRIPKRVKECNHAFDGCVNLRELTVGPANMTIRDIVQNPESIDVITLEGARKGIPYCMFAGCSNLVSISIPEGVTRIRNRAFEGCVRLKTIKIPEGVTEIELEAFKGCSGLLSVELPKSLTRIGSAAFMGCCSLTSISLPDGVRHLEAKTFAGCVNLKTINKSSETLFEEDTFAGCDHLPAADKLDPRKREALKYQEEQKARDKEFRAMSESISSALNDTVKRSVEVSRAAALGKSNAPEDLQIVLNRAGGKAESSGSMGKWVFLLLVMGGFGACVYVHSRKHQCSYVSSLKELVSMALSAIIRLLNALKEKAK